MMNGTAEGTDFCPLMGLTFNDTFCGVHMRFGEVSNPEFSVFFCLSLNPERELISVTEKILRFDFVL